MKFLNFSTSRKEQQAAELKRRVDDGDAILRMTQTDGWKILASLYGEQLEAYKADMLLGCKDWSDYLDKRGKAFAINLLLQDIEDFVSQAVDATEEIESQRPG